MCGICGLYDFGGSRSADAATIEAMAATLTHRGPDDVGIHLSGGLGLGFRRLSIIDLAGGHQPMSDAEESVWVVFNGEIYNFQDLRQELERHGHVFRTRCDTEVIIHGYKQWGIKVLDRLNGMFGIALWDASRRRLILARDPMGIKLVYYRIADGTVYFGSEIRAILAALPQRPAVDTAGLHDLLVYGYVPSPRTLYAGIQKLAPGAMAIFENGEARIERWYTLAPEPITHRITESEAAEELEAIYRRALRRQLVSDVPVGLLLSGGVDSALLLAMMSGEGSGWHTYTVGYGRDLYADDELADAAETARWFGAEHAAVQLDQGLFATQFCDIVGKLEEPIAASSIVPMSFVCARARQDVKVALIGQGPDELFAGYVRHLGVAYGRHWRQVPTWGRQGIEAVVRRLPRNEALKRGLYALSTEDRALRYRKVLSILPGDAASRLLRPEHRPEVGADTTAEWWQGLDAALAPADELGGFLAVELRSALPDKLLMYADKLSMAHSLEVRVPYLDREVVEFVERLPSSFKVRFGERKRLHRRVCRKLLPEQILRRRKRGFAVDAVDTWFRDRGPGMVEAYLLDPGTRIADYVDTGAIQTLVADHRAGHADNHKTLFNLIALEAWLRSTVDVPAQVGDLDSSSRSSRRRAA